MLNNVKRVVVVVIRSCAASIIFGLLTATLVTLRIKPSLSMLAYSMATLQVLVTSSAMTFLPFLLVYIYQYYKRVHDLEGKLHNREETIQDFLNREKNVCGIMVRQTHKIKELERATQRKTSLGISFLY